MNKDKIIWGLIILCFIVLGFLAVDKLERKGFETSQQIMKGRLNY